MSGRSLTSQQSDTGTGLSLAAIDNGCSVVAQDCKRDGQGRPFRDATLWFREAERSLPASPWGPSPR
jgi:hypothetical protein